MSDQYPPPPPPPSQPGWPPPPPPPQPGYDPYAQQQPYAPYPGMPGSRVSPAGQPLAEWWKRLVAYIIDGLVVGVPIGVLFIVAIAIAGSTATTDPITGEEELAGAGILLILFAYAALFLIPFVYLSVLNGGDRGQTVGKRVMSIQVRDSTTGGPIGIGKGFLRQFIAIIIGFVPCGSILDGLWPLWDSQRQALHDKVVSSVVVDVPR